MIDKSAVADMAEMNLALARSRGGRRIKRGKAGKSKSGKLIRKC